MHCDASYATCIILQLQVCYSISTYCIITLQTLFLRLCLISSFRYSADMHVGHRAFINPERYTILLLSDTDVNMQIMLCATHCSLNLHFAIASTKKKKITSYTQFVISNINVFVSLVRY